MCDVLQTVAKWAQAGESVALATVIETRRSVPRAPGSKMAVSSSGEIAGSVSGGCVEGAVVELAERVLAGAPPQVARFGFADEEAWEVGLPCGGEISVLVERYEP